MHDHDALDQRVLAHVAKGLVTAMGMDRTEIPAPELERFGALDLMAGDIELLGRAVDSLALAEVLVGIEDELGIFVLDELEAEGRGSQVSDLVRSVVEQVPAPAVERWLGR